MKNATYLYFYSQNGEISPILLTSIAHYSYFSNRYVLVTNITKEKFPHIFRERIEIIDIADVETSETKSISHEIMMMWDRNILKANCPAVELHCFLVGLDNGGGYFISLAVENSDPATRTETQDIEAVVGFAFWKYEFFRVPVFRGNIESVHQQK